MPIDKLDYADYFIKGFTLAADTLGRTFGWMLFFFIVIFGSPFAVVGWLSIKCKRRKR